MQRRCRPTFSHRQKTAFFAFGDSQASRWAYWRLCADVFNTVECINSDSIPLSAPVVWVVPFSSRSTNTIRKGNNTNKSFNNNPRTWRWYIPPFFGGYLSVAIHQLCMLLNLYEWWRCYLPGLSHRHRFCFDGLYSHRLWSMEVADETFSTLTKTSSELTNKYFHQNDITKYLSTLFFFCFFFFRRIENSHGHSSSSAEYTTSSAHTFFTFKWNANANVAERSLLSLFYCYLGSGIIIIIMCCMRDIRENENENITFWLFQLATVVAIILLLHRRQEWGIDKRCEGQRSSLTKRTRTNWAWARPFQSLVEACKCLSAWTWYMRGH